MEEILDTSAVKHAFSQSIKADLDTAKSSLAAVDYAELLDELADECEQRILTMEV